MKNRIVLGVGGTTADFAVSMEDMGPRGTSYKEEQKL